MSLLQDLSGFARGRVVVGGVQLYELLASDLAPEQPGEGQDSGLYAGLRRPVVVGDRSTRSRIHTPVDAAFLFIGPALPFPEGRCGPGV